jgi:hypothetical protein
MLRPIAAFLFAPALFAQSGPAFDATQGAGSTPNALPAVSTVPSTPLSSLVGAWSDNFNRPDAATLGPDWLPQTGSFGIDTNRGWATGSSSQWTRHASAASSYANAVASIDFLPKIQGSSLVYVALVFGISSQTDNVFLKVQDNDSNGFYDRVYFYRGINGSSWTGQTGTSFPLVTPTASGRMTCYFTNNGDTANVDIDNNFDGTVDEHFETNGVLNLAPVLGTGFGIGCFNNPAVDNWSASDGTPTGPITYCTAGTTTNGCVAAISASANPSVTFANACNISVASVEGQKSGLIFYSVSGQLIQAWNTSSFLCVKAPTQRSNTQVSGGTVGACDGTLSLDWNAFQAANPTALGNPWSAGNKVQVQAWFRDPPAGKATNLSDAVELTYAP